jgi:hypothetical protein
MYILIAIFFTGAGTHGSLYHYRAATTLGEYSSLASCQAAAAATQKVSMGIKDDAYGGMKFVCAKK